MPPFGIYPDGTRRQFAVATDHLAGLLRGCRLSGCIGVVGEDVRRTTYTRVDRQKFRRKVQLCLDVFATMLDTVEF